MIPTLRKLFRLPTPVELGWSTTNALPSRKFQPGILGWTWEDYHVEMKTKYPVRYFLCETLRGIISSYILHPLSRLRWYFIERWLKKNHLLDLRQASWVPECDEYEWGYIDPRTEMLYACMNSLDRFIHESHARSHLDWLVQQVLTADECEKSVLQQNILLYTEALEIHKWWNVDRKAHFVKLCNCDDYTTTETKRLTFERWDAFEEEEDRMMERLMRIRRGLWC